MHALALSEKEQAELAGALLDSLETSHSDPDDVEVAWRREVAARLAEFDSGAGVPWQQVRERLWARLREPSAG
jgi:putative addiction module component (TIGR02574 family)